MTKCKEIKIEDIFEELNLTNDISKNNTIKTELIPLDTILGGGIKNGNIMQIVGETATGKTSISLEVSLAFCLKQKKVLYIDTENSVSIEKLTKLGLDKFNNTNFFYCRINTFTQLEKVLDKFIQTDELSLVVIDSIASLQNEGYLNLETKGKKKGIGIDNNNSNYDSRPLSLCIRKYSALATTHNFSMLITNQMRTKIDKRLGTINKRYGSKALDYACHTILKINSSTESDFKSKFEKLKGCGVFEFEVVKSDCLCPKTKIPFVLKYGVGISNICNFIYYFLKKDLIKQNGTYYTFDILNIKTNGMEKLITEINKCISPLNEKFRTYVEEFYKSSIQEL